MAIHPGDSDCCNAIQDTTALTHRPPPGGTPSPRGWSGHMQCRWHRCQMALKPVRKVLKQNKPLQFKQSLYRCLDSNVAGYHHCNHSFNACTIYACGHTTSLHDATQWLANGHGNQHPAYSSQNFTQLNSQEATRNVHTPSMRYTFHPWKVTRSMPSIHVHPT